MTVIASRGKHVPEEAKRDEDSAEISFVLTIVRISDGGTLRGPRASWASLSNVPYAVPSSVNFPPHSLIKRRLPATFNLFRLMNIILYRRREIRIYTGTRCNDLEFRQFSSNYAPFDFRSEFCVLQFLVPSDRFPRSRRTIYLWTSARVNRAARITRGAISGAQKSSIKEYY